MQPWCSLTELSLARHDASSHSFTSRVRFKPGKASLKWFWKCRLLSVSGLKRLFRKRPIVLSPFPLSFCFHSQPCEQFRANTQRRERYMFDKDLYQGRCKHKHRSWCAGKQQGTMFFRAQTSFRKSPGSVDHVAAGKYQLGTKRLIVDEKIPCVYGKKQKLTKCNAGPINLR